MRCGAILTIVLYEDVVALVAPRDSSYPAVFGVNGTSDASLCSVPRNKGLLIIRSCDTTSSDQLKRSGEPARFGPALAREVIITSQTMSPSTLITLSFLLHTVRALKWTSGDGGERCRRWSISCPGTSESQMKSSCPSRSSKEYLRK